MNRANPIRLQRMRSRFIALYDSAKRAHRGQATASRKLCKATTELLKAEVAAHQRRAKAAEKARPSAAMPDLFAMEHAHA
ncbi:hypothetical protein [Microvirga solisilvae]|uniref:hypothetical protein n=1 Tax=Microvirga solisilvae TaxID=2919498 RepID=UPI001FAF1918|nr:hypothetical protein [Microvirga solisilvae]